MLLQVSTKLKVGVMWDHNGTYMEGYGFQYRDHGIIVDLDDKDEVTGGPHSYLLWKSIQQIFEMQSDLPQKLPACNDKTSSTKRAAVSFSGLYLSSL